MPRHKLVVLTNATDGQDDAFNRWYDEVHIGDVLKVPGMVDAKRFRLEGGDGRWRYLALYEMECDDPEAVIAELTSRAGTDAMPLTDALDMESVYMATATPLQSAKA